MNCRTCKHSDETGSNRIHESGSKNKNCIECMTEGNLRGYEPRLDSNKIALKWIFLLAIIRLIKTASTFSLVCGLWLYGLKYFIPLMSIAVVSSIIYEWLATDLKIRISRLK